MVTALTAGLNSDDATVTWYVSQRAVKDLPPIETVIQSLIRKLGSNDLNTYWSASDVLKAYGMKARPYANQIVDVVLQSRTGSQTQDVHSLRHWITRFCCRKTC